MSGPELTLRQFGEDAGIPNLTFDARGQAVLRTESGRQIGVELAEREILVYVSLPLDYDAGAWMQRAWKRAHHGRQGEWPVQAALREQPEGGQRLLALTRVTEPEFTPLRLRQALEYLSSWLDEIRHDA